MTHAHGRKIRTFLECLWLVLCLNGGGDGLNGGGDGLFVRMCMVV